MIGLKSVPLANSQHWSSKAILQALSCVVSTSKLSPKGMPNAISAFHREHIVLWLCGKMTWRVRVNEGGEF